MDIGPELDGPFPYRAFRFPGCAHLIRPPNDLAETTPNVGAAQRFWKKSAGTMAEDHLHERTISLRDSDAKGALGVDSSLGLGEITRQTGI
jgi:hypothetical protein